MYSMICMHAACLPGNYPCQGEMDEKNENETQAVSCSFISTYGMIQRTTCASRVPVFRSFTYSIMTKYLVSWLFFFPLFFLFFPLYFPLCFFPFFSQRKVDTEVVEPDIKIIGTSSRPKVGQTATLCFVLRSMFFRFF